MNVNSINKFKEAIDSNFAQEKINTKESNNKTLEDVAKDFESLFVYQMMKSSRKAKLAEGVLSNSANDTYFSLLDQEYSKIISKNQSFGIAEALVRQFGEKKVK
tara:strand:- start:96 stop:407 length:312 start_codon:yes stop_codon:yes gene_type:complete